ncbi:MAG: hypothetical protein LQ341_002045 [Variospora aurantia]|nr:MAG: hypothetical protein LQ341_002045 [Variospora aurantia]
MAVGISQERIALGERSSVVQKTLEELKAGGKGLKFVGRGVQLKPNAILFHNDWKFAGMGMLHASAGSDGADAYCSREEDAWRSAEEARRDGFTGVDSLSEDVQG